MIDISPLLVDFIKHTTSNIYHIYCILITSTVTERSTKQNGRQNIPNKD